MTERVIVAGFGGQGVMLLGKLLAHAMMLLDYNITFFPAYGTEVRGGTAHCHIIISSTEICSPVVEQADSLIMMNQPSYEKFRGNLIKGGTLLTNSSLVEPNDLSTDVRLLPIPATEIANELGNVKVANMVMMGAYSQAKHLMTEEHLLRCLQKSLSHKEALFDLNKEAISRGMQIADKIS